MIRDVVLHMTSEQPMMADLQAMPTAADACLVCTNLRSMNGKKPSFTDHLDSWFLIPLGMVRFVEVPKSSVDQPEGLVPRPTSYFDDAHLEVDPLMDAELIRRVREA